MSQFAEPNSDALSGCYRVNVSTGTRASGFGTIGSTSVLLNRTIQLRLHLYF